ncbi:putative secreted protein with PEP-CTERM sorting signal [Halospina denitrificans]|uniref:Putative secreted protein with PEP-CTERM sorting signal n=1 Tax=Halospina denitrificans TaxID=332522 RepID=A0A4V3EPW5_9GAMM|nr:PEP-CTERM sorting domain-containing protein [Halospina denitrificans]TDT39458.1 putative secreted protein with PEP-CTERM sorting signal [Halospina denitrificans]
MKIRAAVIALFLLPAIANAALVSWEFDNTLIGSTSPGDLDFYDHVDGLLLWETDGSNFDLLGASFTGDEFAFTMHQGSGAVNLNYGKGSPGSLYMWSGQADANGEITNWRGNAVNIPASFGLNLESDNISEPGDPIKDQIWTNIDNDGFFGFDVEGVRASLGFWSVPEITVLSKDPESAKVPEPATLGLLAIGLALIGLRRRII